MADCAATGFIYETSGATNGWTTDERTDGMHAVPFILAIPFKLAERDRFYDDAERFTHTSLSSVPASNHPDS